MSFEVQCDCRGSDEGGDMPVGDAFAAGEMPRGWHSTAQPVVKGCFAQGIFGNTSLN